LGSCGFLSQASGTTTLTVNIDASSAVSRSARAKAVVPALATSYTISFNDGKTNHSTTVTSGQAASFTEVYYGTFDITVSATINGETVNVTKSVTLAEGGSQNVTIYCPAQTSAGKGSFSLDVEWPTSIGVSTVTAALSGTTYTISVGTISTVTNDATKSTTTISGTDISSGAYTLTLTFKNSSGVTLATVIETVNIFDGLTSKKWIDSTGALLDKLSLDDTIFANSNTAMVLRYQLSDSLDYTPVNLVSTGIKEVNLPLTLASNIYFLATQAVDGQSFAYQLCTDCAAVSTSSWTSFMPGSSISLSLTASKLNQLYLKVTAPDGGTSALYRINVMKAAASVTTITTITTVQQLHNLTLTGNYLLGCDINIAGYNDWTPLGNSTTAFTGILDGQGFTISGLTINSVNNNCGLFGVIGSAGRVMNLKLANVNVTNTQSTSQFTSALAGVSNGSLYRCGVISGLVTSAGSFVGGLVGVTYAGTVDECFSCATVTSSRTSSYDAMVGGLIGDNKCAVTNCYSTGTVNAQAKRIGGLLGRFEGTGSALVVRNCYACSTVTGVDPKGELIGSISDTSLYTCSGCYYLDDNNITSTYGTALTTAQLHEKINFTGWDFDSIWGMGANHPYLRYFGDN
jgi:hypothetical protein